MTPSRDQLADLFAAHKLRFTRQRAAVYLALLHAKSHPTVDEIYRNVRDDDHGISLATIYNTLEAFCKTGLAQKLATDGLCARYDATTHNHLHFRDSETGKVEDVPEDLSRMLLEHLPKDVLDRIEKQMGRKVQEVKIELVG